MGLIFAVEELEVSVPPEVISAPEAIFKMTEGLGDADSHEAEAEVEVEAEVEDNPLGGPEITKGISFQTRITLPLM